MRQYLFFLVLAVLTGCHSPKPVERVSFEPSTVWPLSRHTVWLNDADKILLEEKDWHALIIRSQVYSALHRDILLVEANHKIEDVEHEAQALDRLISQHHFLKARDAFMVLARHSSHKLEAYRTHPLVEIAYINRVYGLSDWAKVMEKTCNDGNTYACVSMHESIPKKLVLLLPLKNQLASSARAFRQGFMASLLHDKAQIDVETIDTASLDMRTIEQKLKEIQPDWVIGPMEKKWIQKLQRKRLPYPTVFLGECEAPLAKNNYCFSIASSTEVPLWVSRLQTIGIQEIWLVTDTKEWYNKWAKGFARLWKRKLTEDTVVDYTLWKDQLRHRLKDGQGLPVQDIRKLAFVFTMPSQKARELKNYLDYQATDSLVAAPSVVAESKNIQNIQYYTMPLLAHRSPEYLPQAWNDIANILEHDGKNMRFKAWGMDVYAYIRSGEQGRFLVSEKLPYEGATGVSYVVDNRVIRSMDLVEAKP